MIDFWRSCFITKGIVGACCAMFCIIAFAAPSTEGIQTYQKNMHLFPEHKQNLANDIDRYHNADNLWSQLRAEFTLPHYEENPLVQNQINWFMNHQDYLIHSVTRAAPFLYYIWQQVKKRHLPAEFVLLPIIESAYNPFAYSSTGAAGIWQLMPKTASGYGIKQNWWYDGRRDIVASTKAALDHLSYLGTYFDGNWLLATAAYDTGQGNVLSAIRRSYRDSGRAEFWTLPVAQETKDYVPRLLALAIIISHPEEYPINFPSVSNAPYLAQVDIGAQIDLKNAAYLAGLSLKNIMQLNPGYSRSAELHGPSKIVLPIENVQQFTENLAHLPLDQLRSVHYKTHSGDTMTSLSKKFNIPLAQLYLSNPKTTEPLKPGTQLIIPNFTESTDENTLGDNLEYVDRSTKHTQPTKVFEAISPEEINPLEEYENNYSMQPEDTIYMARAGDDLNKIATHFHLPVKTLLTANRRTSTVVQVGEKLIIPTHLTQQSDYQLAPGDTVYMVRTGDTIETIAEKFHISPSNIRIANLMASNDVVEGDRLVIPTHTSF